MGLFGKTGHSGNPKTKLDELVNMGPLFFREHPSAWSLKEKPEGKLFPALRAPVVERFRREKLDLDPVCLQRAASYHR